jgi:hypothetical protein
LVAGHIGRHRESPIGRPGGPRFRGLHEGERLGGRVNREALPGSYCVSRLVDHKGTANLRAQYGRKANPSHEKDQRSGWEHHLILPAAARYRQVFSRADMTSDISCDIS